LNFNKKCLNIYGRVNIYELHVGTFTAEGTFDAVIPHLDRLVDTGITAVELRPVAQFPGSRNWGYDGVYPFAAQNSYGGPEGLKKLADACAELSEAPIYIDDASTLSPLELRAKARRLKSRYNIRCIVVDYLQLMHLGSGRIESRQQEITAISRYIKALARELNIPVIVLSQLNRSPEGREGHRPRMSDLRESGSIEQDADVVMLLHREDYYRRNEDDYQQDNTAELIIAKQRNGPTGTVKLTFRERITRFENASSVQEPTGGGVPF